MKGSEGGAKRQWKRRTWWLGLCADGQTDLDGVGEKVWAAKMAIRLDENHTRCLRFTGHNEILKKFRLNRHRLRHPHWLCLVRAGLASWSGDRSTSCLQKPCAVGNTALPRDDRGTAGGLACTGKTNCKLESFSRMAVAKSQPNLDDDQSIEGEQTSETRNWTYEVGAAEGNTLRHPNQAAEGVTQE